MRVVRVIIGTLLVVVALPMLVTGGALWGAMQHRGSDGAFTARISELSADGYAVVVPDLDGLLRREASFARAGQTTLRIAGTGPEKLFIGIAARSDVDRYLGGHPRSQLTRVRLARGPLPVDLSPVPVTPAAAAPTAPTAPAGEGPQPGIAAPPVNPMPPGDPAPPVNPAPPGDPAPLAGGVAPPGQPAPPGAPTPPAPVGATEPPALPGANASSAPPDPPASRPFWLVASRDVTGGVMVSWSPSSMRGRDVTLVVMNASGAPRVSADLTATVNPRWLNPSTWGLLILGTVLFVLGSAALVWPRRHRDIVYVVEPSQLPEISARLGVSTSPTFGSASHAPTEPWSWSVGSSETVVSGSTGSTGSTGATATADGAAPAGRAGAKTGRAGATTVGSGRAGATTVGSGRRRPARSGPVPWFAGFALGLHPEGGSTISPPVRVQPEPEPAAAKPMIWPPARPDGRTAAVVTPPPDEPVPDASPDPVADDDGEPVDAGEAGRAGGGDVKPVMAGDTGRAAVKPEPARIVDPLSAPIEAVVGLEKAAAVDQPDSPDHSPSAEATGPVSLPEWLSTPGSVESDTNETPRDDQLVAAS